MKAKILFTLILTFFLLPKALANSPVSSGKFKNWEAFTLKGENNDNEKYIQNKVFLVIVFD